MRRRVNNNTQSSNNSKNRNHNSTFAPSRMMPSSQSTNNSTTRSSSQSSSSSTSKEGKIMNPLHPVVNSIHHEKSLGITQRRSASSGTPQFVPANSSTKNNKESSGPLTPVMTNDSTSSSRPQSPKSPIIPTIADFMIHDEDYGNGKKQPYYAASHPHNQYSYNIQCAKFCTYFSFIAILFLVTVGILIEVQPLYIKGVSPERVPMSFRKMRESHGGGSSEKELLSYVHYSGRLRMLQSYYLHQKHQSSSSSSSLLDSSSILNTPRLGTYDDDPTTNYVKYNEYLRNLSNEQKEYIVYEMKSEAKTSFKAAALYFVVMVFCIIYTHNLERVHLLLGIGFNMWIRRIKNFFLHGGWRHCFVVLLNKYRRREYRDIPERNMFRGSGSARKNSASDTRSMMNDSTSIAPRVVSADLTSDSRNTSYESMIGLSMRERDLVAGGGHFEHKDQQQLVKDPSFDDIEDKPKKK